jgi:transglutaminase-like putative cysteine protease
MQQFLESSQYIDLDHPLIAAKALEVAMNCSSKEEIAQKCFTFVRDSIKHSWDYKLNPVTCKASDVLIHGTGYCYAKSHLLAALLRANGIPTGLCYQRLTITDQPPYCLHGLNAVYLEQHGWYKVDARGNKTGVDADFCPPHEKLAFATVRSGEQTFSEIWSEPDPSVIQALTRYDTIEEVHANLPDIH